MKKIFYYTDILPFLGREEDAIGKLKRNLKIFLDSSDKVQLVWHPWSETEKYLMLNNSSVLDRYRSIVDTYRKERWGELDESDSFDDAKKVLFTCDGYYGDVSDLAYEAQRSGIPVMVQDIDV